MRKYFHLGLPLLAALITNQVQASQIEAPLTASVIITKPDARGTDGSPLKKEVYLMPVKLTAKQKQQFQKPVKTSLKLSGFALPVKAEVSMNGTPVLDQGRHGSCVTFAVTGALNAMLGKGDYISQLCSLSLGSYLEKRGYLPSGWNGSMGAFVLNQIQQYGIVTKDIQKSQSCAGVTEYPVKNAENQGNPMSLDEHKQKSIGLDQLDNFLYWQPMVTLLQRIMWDPEKLDADKLLIKVKQSIARKLDDKVEKVEAKTERRLTFGVLLPFLHCSAGACGTYQNKNDTWAMTKAIKDDQEPAYGGHEMIITGYDDNAIVIDNEGEKHRGLLVLRNSWGDDVGDKGNYYMTYEFFKHYVMEVQEIYLFSENNNRNN